MSPNYVPLNHVTLARRADRPRRPSGVGQRIARAFHVVCAGSRLLHAAVVAALLVAANQTVESWTEGNIITAWIVLWLLAFAALALLAGPSRRATASMRAAFRAWNERRARAEWDEQYWDTALSDPRIMAEIRRAMGASDLQYACTASHQLRWPFLLYVPSL